MNRDARTLAPEAQFEIRRQAIVHFKKGVTRLEIAKLLEVDRNTVGKWIRVYQEKGIRALKSTQPQKKRSQKRSSSEAF